MSAQAQPGRRTNTHSWASLCPGDSNKQHMESRTDTRDEPRFPVKHLLNTKVLLSRDPLLSQDTESIVNTTNETLCETSGISGSILRSAGADLFKECQSIARCPTGSAVATKGYQLPFTYIMHCVAPRYKSKYHTAAEHALHTCYRKTLELVVGKGLRSVAFPLVNLERKGYPERQAVHVAVRTVRRFLEKLGDRLDAIVFVLEQDWDWDMYVEVMSLYFPRNEQESEESERMLPRDVGDEWGDTFLEERRIRISQGISGTSSQREIEIANELLECSFGEMIEGPDEMRGGESAGMLQSLTEMTFGSLEKTRDFEKRYSAFVRQSGIESLGDIAKLNFLYHSGYDDFGRPILVVLLKQFPVDCMDSLSRERILLYIVKVMHDLVQNDYVMVWVNSGRDDSHPSPECEDVSSSSGTDWMQTFYSLFPSSYYENLKHITILHPDWWIRIGLWMSIPFLGADFPFRVVYCTRISQLFQEYTPQQLKLPPNTFQ